ncbi:Spo0E family sporulation regulatory protein-aspartic acid phosphatase, partial [Bacillus inaquosorum]|nr:Spo0E family sporulation regulatory protein-aspartic acid phosphatase [Bacillus inaquosorum]
KLSQELDHLLIQYQKQRLRAVAGDD